jgi:hypothetical protein
MLPVRLARLQRVEREAARTSRAEPWHIGEVLPTVLAAVLGEPEERHVTPVATVTPAVVPQPWWSQSWQAVPAAALFGQTG